MKQSWRFRNSIAISCLAVAVIGVLVQAIAFASVDPVAESTIYKTPVSEVSQINPATGEDMTLIMVNSSSLTTQKVPDAIQPVRTIIGSTLGNESNPILDVNLNRVLGFISADPNIESNLYPLPASGIIYVNPITGDDGNLGTMSSPYQTIQKALDTVQPGETIKLSSGIYQEVNKTIRAGTTSAPIIIEPDNGAKPILDGKSNTLNAILIRHSFYIVRNLEIRNARRGVKIDGATGVVLENNAIHDINYDGVRLRNSSQMNILKNNIIWATGLAGNFNGEGIYIGTAPEHRYMNGGQPDVSSNNTIIGNQIFNTTEGIDIKEDSSFNIVAGNIIYNTTDPKSGGINVRADNNYFYGNVSYNNAGAGFRFGGDITDSPKFGDSYHYGVENVLRNNISRNNAGAGYKFMNGPQDVASSNIGVGNGASLYSYGAGVAPSKPGGIY